MGGSCQFHRLYALQPNTINKLTGRSGPFSRLYPVSMNSFAAQLVKNGALKTRSRESPTLVNKQLSELWKTPTPERKQYL